MVMKKLTKTFAALVLLLCGFVLAGCTEEETEILMGPENTWCRMPVTYTSDSDSSSIADLYVWCYYTATEVKGTGAAGGLKSGITLPAGITMVVIPQTDASSVISGLVNNTYIIKTFEKDTATTGLDSTDTSYSFKGSKAAWTALYWGKSDLRVSSNQTKSAPPVLQSSSSTELSWDSIKSSFSWKKLLANYLLNSLE